jgi:hypothetical protein
MESIRRDLEREIRELALVDTHEHLQAEQEWVADNPQLLQGLREMAPELDWDDVRFDVLHDLFLNYVPSDLLVAGATQAELGRLFNPSAGDLESRFAGIRCVGGDPAHRLREGRSASRERDLWVG